MMKKPLYYIVVAAIACFLPLASTQAENTSSSPKAQVTPPSVLGVTATAETSLETESLSVRKAKAEAELRAIHSQFTLFATRTQLTIDRLAAKKIDTAAAQTKLDASVNSLGIAKTNLDLFAGISVGDVALDQETDTTELKATLKVIEDSLRAARTDLIESLSALKASVAVSIDAQ